MRVVPWLRFGLWYYGGSDNGRFEDFGDVGSLLLLWGYYFQVSGVMRSLVVVSFWEVGVCRFLSLFFCHWLILLYYSNINIIVQACSVLVQLYFLMV